MIAKLNIEHTVMCLDTFSHITYQWMIYLRAKLTVKQQVLNLINYKLISTYAWFSLVVKSQTKRFSFNNVRGTGMVSSVGEK